MDINHGNRRRRCLLRRVVGCQLLLLVVLWHFDAASREDAAVWRPVNKISAYVSSMALTKDIVILNHKEQKPYTMGVCNDIIKLSLVYSTDSASFFSWPICRSVMAEVISASGDDVIYGVLQIAINSKDHVTASKITTRPRTYGGGEPIILETVTEDGVRKIRGRGGWLAVRRVGSEPEAVMDWADIGAELPMLSVLGGVDLVPSGISEPIGRLDSSFGVLPGGSHLAQLTAHGIPLEQRGEERQYGNPGDYSGPDDQLSSNRREAVRFPYKRIFLGICVIGLGWVCLWFSFKSFEKISQSPRYIAGGIILGVIAVALIGHGLFYACLGVWGLPSLYVL